MTEHFTRDDVIAAGGIVHRDGNVFFTNLDKMNAMFAAKLKEWEAQGAAHWHIAEGFSTYNAHTLSNTVREMLARTNPAIREMYPIPLYTRALPAQSEDVSQRAFKAAQVSMQHYRQTMLHAPPAQPAEEFQWATMLGKGHQDAMSADPVNAELVKALKDLCEFSETAGFPTERARAALSRAQAAPSVGVPDKHLANLRNATNILQSLLNGNTSPQLAQAAVNAFNEYLDASAQPQQKEG